MRLLTLGPLVVFALLPLVCVAQQTESAPVSPAKSADLYAGEAFVIERADSRYVMNADGTGYYERTLAAKLQSDAAVRDVGVITLPFASAVSHVEFKYARARHPDGSVTETPLSDLMEQPAQVTVQAPFYSDLKQAQLPVKGLKVGDTLEWQARIVITKAESPGQFWSQETFVSEGVIREETMSLSVPTGTAVTVWTNPKAETKLDERTEGNRHIYEWRHSDLKTAAERKAETEKKKTKVLSAEEEQDAELGKLPSVAWTTFKSWAAVGAWYRGLEGDRETPSDDVKTKVAELTRDKTTEEAKVRAVYAYASAQIRYVGVAFGVGRYQPHRAEVVLENQYGDCKDKHTLLAAMLLALGLHPDAVLIGAGVRFNEAVPSPSAFNHMITRVQVGGKEVWLDSTAEVAPYRMLEEPIRDEQALVVPDSGPATIERTPKELPFAAMQRWEAKGTLDEKGVSDSHITLTMRGDTELLLRSVLRQVPPTQYDLFAKKLLEGIGYQGTPTNTLISRPEVTDEPLTIAFDYHREQGSTWENHQVLPQFAPVALPTVNDKEPPVRPIELETPRVETSTTEMKVPTGWGAELPEAVHEKTDFASYDVTYQFEKGTLYAERRVEILKDKVPAADWKSYKKWQDAVGLGLENYVQLTKTGASGAGKTFTVPSEGGSKGPAFETDGVSAEKLLQQAMEALRQFDTAKAKTLLDEAKAKNPDQRGLWAGYGAVAAALGERNEGVRDLQKELALHPDSINVYALLASLQLQGNDRDAAEATMKSWIAADNLDLRPVNFLLANLYAWGKFDDGLAAVDAARKQLPEEQQQNEQFRLNVAQIEMKGGRPKQGTDELVKLLNTAQSPLTLNNAAYLLSEAGAELPLAEQSVKTALDKLTKESENWTLDEAPSVLKQQSSLLVASWDTLGWILFREGKLPEALDYCEAAWRNDLHEEVGGHVVAIREALAKPAEASRLEKADPPKGKAANPEPGKSEQDMRMVPLGAAKGRKGAAGYRLLISHGAVERAVLDDKKEMDGGVGLLQTLKLPQYTPAASDAKLVREVVLNCFAEKCQVVFAPQ